MSREFSHVREHPLPGDVVSVTGSGEEEVMLRVLAVADDHVGYKEYGKGRFWVHIKGWRARLQAAAVGKLIRGGDHDCPFEWPDRRTEDCMLADASQLQSEYDPTSTGHDAGCHIKALLCRVRSLETAGEQARKVLRSCYAVFRHKQISPPMGAGVQQRMEEECVSAIQAFEASHEPRS